MIRKCWNCGNTHEHESDVYPGVLCPECGSWDTRLVRKPEPANPPPKRDHIADAIASISRENNHFGLPSAEKCIALLVEHGAAMPIDPSVAANIVAIYGRELTLATLEFIQKKLAAEAPK